MVDPFWPANGVFDAKGQTSGWSGFRAKNQERRTLFAARVAVDQNKIVFVGDSITEGWQTLEQDFAGLPVGVKIVGPYLEDRTTIRFAQLLADAVGGFEPPPGWR